MTLIRGEVQWVRTHAEWPVPGSRINSTEGVSVSFHAPPSKLRINAAEAIIVELNETLNLWLSLSAVAPTAERWNIGHNDSRKYRKLRFLGRVELTPLFVSEQGSSGILESHLLEPVDQRGALTYEVLNQGISSQLEWLDCQNIFVPMLGFGETAEQINEIFGKSPRVFSTREVEPLTRDAKSGFI